ncbi:hypothetical protein D3C80_2070860 [compost metagenome]
MKEEYENIISSVYGIKDYFGFPKPRETMVIEIMNDKWESCQCEGIEQLIQ